MGKSREILAWQLTKVRNKNEVIAEARNEGRTVHFASLMDVSSQQFGAGTTISEIQRSSRSPRWYCGRRFWVLRSIHRTRIISITNDGCKSHGYFSRPPGCARHAADAVFAYTPVKMEDAPTLLKIPKSECPDFWIRLPKHK